MKSIQAITKVANESQPMYYHSQDINYMAWDSILMAYLGQCTSMYIFVYYSPPGF